MELPDFEWSSEATELGDLVDKFSLPLVARLVAASTERENNKDTGGGDPGSQAFVPPPTDSLGPLLDVTQPVFVYSQRRRTKGYARHMVPDPKFKGYVPDGKLVEIPKDYTGFFEIVPNNPKYTPSHYSNIRKVASSTCSRFLVRTITGGFRALQTPDGDLTILAKHMIYPGEVLRPVCTVTKRWKLQDNPDKPAESQYLQCVDLTGQVVYVPLAHPGTFCALYDKGADSKHFVWKIDNLLEHFRLPVTIRLVFGWPPKFTDGTTFSGVLQLIDRHRQDTLVLSSLTEKLAVFCELPVDAQLYLEPVSNNDKLANTDVYINALSRCDRLVYNYVINMKPLTLYYDVKEGASRAGRRPIVPSGLLPAAQDMSTFSAREIFPPLDEKNISSAWPITFKDPLTESTKDEPSGENDMNPKDDGKRPQLSRNKSLSGHTREKATAPRRQEQKVSDARKSRVVEADKREARC